MGELVEGRFPKHDNPDDVAEGLIGPQYLVAPLSRVDQLIYGEKVDRHIEVPAILEADKRGAHASYGYRQIRLHAPLGWVAELSDIADKELGSEMTSLSQAYFLTVLYAKKQLDKLDNNDDREKKLLELTPVTHFSVGGEKLEIEYHNARDVQLWQAAAAVALRATTAPDSVQRQQLHDFLRSLKAEELQIQLEGQGFNPHKSRLKKLFGKKQTYELEGYKVGCLTPMSAERLAEVSPQFIRAASN